MENSRVPSETTLLQRARSFDHDALTEIYDLYSPGLYRYAQRLLGDPILAEECVSEIFTRFLQILRKQKGPQVYLQAYLYKIAHNWITDHFRHNVPVEELDDEGSDKSPDPEQAAGEILRQERLRVLLKRLTPDQRQVIALKFFEEWDNDQISLALNKPVGAVKSLQHRALANLKRWISIEEL